MAVKTVFFLYLFCLWLQAQAQQGINLTSSGELCFGQTITLTCTHPDPSQDTAKYEPQLVSWAEDGVRLDLSLQTTRDRFTPTKLNSTVSTLSFTVTEEDHANKVVICSCFLLLNGGGREESDPPITMDVNAKPIIMSKPNDTSGLLQWSPSPSCGAYSYLYIYNLTWVRMEDNSTGTVSAAESKYDFTGMPGGEYTVSLKARVTNFNLTSQPIHDCWITIIRPPTIMSKPSSTSGLLQWRPSSNCSNYQYIFTLTWVRIGDGSTGTVNTTENEYNFTDMPGGEYTVSLKARVANFNFSESISSSEEFNLPAPPTTTTGSLTEDTVVIAIVLVVVIVIVVIITIAIVVICCCRNKKKRVSQSCSPVTESEYSEAPNKKQEAENVELGQTRQELDKKQEAENDQIQYAAIDFSGQRPIAPPSLETVVYTETVEQFRNARKNRPVPPLPPAKTEEEEEEERKLAQEAAEITADFKAQVVAILQASKLVYRTLDPEEPVVGTYQKKTFVANFVHAPGGKEILSSEVEAIIKARELQSTDKGFLMATTDSISGPWLEHLEKHNCHFIGLSRKGGVKKEMLLRKLSFCFPESSSF